MAKIQENTSKISLREAIIDTINAHQGIKGVYLVIKVMEVINPVQFSHNDYQEELKILINEKEIVELEYTLPTIAYRIKSIYFPKGTIFEPQVYR